VYVRDFRGPNCGTDYKLFVAKIFFPLCTQIKQTPREKDNTVRMEDNKIIYY
jgi:hypothetical protein